MDENEGMGRARRSKHEIDGWVVESMRQGVKG